MSAIARVWVPDGTLGPGRLEDVEIATACVEESRLVMPGVDVEDVRGELDLTEHGVDDLRFDPEAGGGPLRPIAEQREARRFGVINAAFHLHRGLDRIGALLGRRLPPLAVKIGMHRSQRPGWGGAHYRLPAPTFASLPEEDPISPLGEIHLGASGAFGWTHGHRYFLAPSHNSAILYHELGHHVTRHTADFRLNARRPPTAQANHKIPLDEGTADYLAGVLLGRSDIYGWHRAHVPATSQRRRCLDVPRNMASFRGGSDRDPHADGTIWAAALWSARSAVQSAGHRRETFDELLLEALDHLGAADAAAPWEAALRRRRYFSNALDSILRAAEARGAGIRAVVEASFAAAGIFVGRSNAELRDSCLAANGIRRQAVA